MGKASRERRIRVTAGLEPPLKHPRPTAAISPRLIVMAIKGMLPIGHRLPRYLRRSRARGGGSLKPSLWELSKGAK